MVTRSACVDPVSGARQSWLHTEIRGRIPKRSTTLISRHDDAVELERPSEYSCSRSDVTIRHGRTDSRRRHALDLRRYDDPEPHALEELEIAATPHAEAEILAGQHHLCPTARR